MENPNKAYQHKVLQLPSQSPELKLIKMLLQNLKRVEHKQILSNQRCKKRGQNSSVMGKESRCCDDPIKVQTSAQLKCWESWA